MSKSEIQLTTSEIASLWAGYINNTSSTCLMKYFYNTVEDEEIKQILEYSLELSLLYTDEIKRILERENFPIPHGFTDQDVNVKAARLFTDIFMLNFVKSMAKVGLGTYALSRSLSARQDVREFYKKCIETTMELDDKSLHLMLNKGILIRSPYLPFPDRVRYVKNQSFMNGFFGERRPLAVQEISNLSTNLDLNLMCESMMTAFGQVADSEKVRDLMWKGRQIAHKHVRIFTKKLVDDNLPAPSLWDTSVTKSKVAPFSDKLMLFITTFLAVTGIGDYGLGVASSMRHDLAFTYIRLTSEIGLFAEEVADLMIENGWLEEPPQAPNREKLIKE
ncbi:DUF3231 family protein [Alkalihalobacillus sp. BA299]|uniref:DUF3231 family protein n=1 Tax=Alkalihalobacillus sp. BA299 TaxID=2815938 RepID=UPI001ADCDB47|nr:DUF3231 family protein [Alkalihalobacillus sp. BA299]